MAYSERLADRIRVVLKRRRGVTEKKMFGGLAFLVNGHMACGVNSNDLMLRVGKDNAERLLKMKHVRPMDFTGKPLTGMVYVGAVGTTRAADLKRLIETAVTFARGLPPR